MSDFKTYSRLDSEGDVAWACFLAYKDLEPPRSITAAYEAYCKIHGKGNRGQKKAKGNAKPQASGAFNRLAKQNNWESRARDFDRDEEDRKRKLAIEHDEINYIKEISEFRKLQVESGKLGVQISLKIKSDVAVYLKMAKANDRTTKIATLREAEQMARILNMVEGKSSDQWSRGLLLNELIAELEGDKTDRA